MRLMTTAAMMLAGTLAACTTTNDILAHEPDEVFRTAHTPREVATCFERSNNLLRVIEREDGALVAIFRNGYGGAANAFSIYPDGTGSRIERRHSFLSMPFIKWKKCVGLEPMPTYDDPAGIKTGIKS